MLSAAIELKHRFVNIMQKRVLIVDDEGCNEYYKRTQINIPLNKQLKIATFIISPDQQLKQ